jgi:hypothetical protein
VKIRIISFIACFTFLLTLKASTKQEENQLSPVDFVRKQYTNIDIIRIQQRHAKACLLAHCKKSQYLNSEEQKIVKYRLWKNIKEYLAQSNLSLVDLNENLIFITLKELPKPVDYSSNRLKIKQEQDISQELYFSSVIIRDKASSSGYSLGDLYNYLNQQEQENWQDYSASELNLLGRRFQESLIIDLALENKSHAMHAEFNWFFNVIYNAVSYEKARRTFVADSKIKAKAMKNISQIDIEKYYKNHIEQFSEISKVDCQHISTSSVEQANQAYEELKNGVPFNRVVIQYSIHEDKKQPTPGLIGNIKNLGLSSDKKKSFLQSLCLQQAETEFSLPTRTLHGFEILRVTNVNRITVPINSPAVQASIKNSLLVKELRRLWNIFLNSDKPAQV